ncbi:MAG TPA: ABC transporter ATP-binding protein [Nitrospirae bacterium]|nr:ABC transporter ATP-binding protein [Nitrospirota bacterium]
MKLNNKTEVASLKNVIKYYRLGDVEITALRDINLTLREGDFAVISGPSGSGKSTLLHILGCIDKPDKGRVIIDGFDTTDVALEALSGLRFIKIGFMFQTFNLIPVLTAYENVELPLLFTGADAASVRSRVVDVLKKVGLSERVNHYPSQLSGGQQQRVAIARALVGSPRLILADEPTANLDSRTGDEILTLLMRLNREEKVTVLIATHDTTIINKAKTVINIKDGELW